MGCAPGGGRKQESKPAGGRDIIEGFLEVCAPEPGLEGCPAAVQGKGGADFQVERRTGARTPRLET